jgi:hypothetical protein
MSAMAGATNPTIKRGMINPRKDENTPLNVTKMQASHSGKINPAPMPAAIAMMMRSSSGIEFKLLKE